ncbi:DUF2793 domain-containing protein [Roseitranquillus sediminis]|uniref:DUF2793 domain-containing protein n=1 Tax=Roseitranquillus sediminis TaxID=2809051 RepID=UPI001D0C15F6|nr:DUF2793 domain-containing protein [Roseitranquillus sediminis]MBM9595200.1 DUF2793 domain-containing protein [Roseitranquillus sediminis]
MSETTRLNLPLLAPSQAQKHVTVNEALLRLDALTQLILVSRSRNDAPADALEGQCFAVPDNAVDEWSGQEGQIAIFTGGGWEYLRPARGWRAWIEDEDVLATYLDTWEAVSGGEAASPANGNALQTIEFDHVVEAGDSSATTKAIPDGAIVLGVTGRVKELIGGAQSFAIGVMASPDRYGSGIGVHAGSWLRGLTSTPQAYWGDTPLLLTAEGGAFDGTGLIRLAIHFFELGLPE